MRNSQTQQWSQWERREKKTFLLREWKNVCNFRKSLLNTQLNSNDMRRSSVEVFFFDRCCWLNFYRTAIDSFNTTKWNSSLNSTSTSDFFFVLRVAFIVVCRRWKIAHEKKVKEIFFNQKINFADSAIDIN